MSNDRRAVAANRRLDQDMAGRRAASADPYLAGWLGRFKFENTGPRDEVGVVVDVMPASYCYLVSAGRNSLVWCSTAGTGAGFGTVGTRPLDTLAIGAVVYFTRHPDHPGFGTIRCVDPHWSTHTANQPSDGVWPFTRTGQFVEPAHQYIPAYSQATAGETPVNLGAVDGADFSAGRPADANSVGQSGVMAETGVGWFVDPYQAYVRADESTGVFCFYPDQLLRVTGHNYQQFSVVAELEHLEDEGELYGYARECVYPWEAYGLWRPNQVPPGWEDAEVANHGLAAGQGSVFTDPYESAAGSGRAVREPESDTQTPAARKYQWGGYLGQGRHSVVAGPAQLDWAYESVPFEPALTAAVGAVTRSDAPAGRFTVEGSAGPAAQALAVPVNDRDGPAQPGLYEEHVTLTGAFHQRVARRWLVTKRMSIPTPRPVRRPEDPAGDSPESGYGASGMAGGTDVHKVAGAVEAPDGAGNMAVLLPDVIAYSFNWENLHPFHYHEEDWEVADEGEAGSDAVNQRVPDYADLAVQQFLDTPEPIYLDVDHRYKLTPYYETESGIALLDDGSVVIYDGWGSEIRMGGGNIEFRASGDVGLHPGRNLVAWAGHDVNVKAHDTIDASAVNGDVFLRSQYKFHAVAGVGGCGGFLFESQADCPAYSFAGLAGSDTVSSGFTVLCKDSAFVVVAQDVAISIHEDAPDESRIFLDAGAERHAYTRSKMFVNHIGTDGSVVHLFAAGQPNEFAGTYTLIGSALSVVGGAYVSGCLAVQDWVQAGTHFASNEAQTYYGRVQYAAFDPASQEADITTRMSAIAGYSAAFDTQDPYPPGVDDAEFTHRSTTQYRTADFTFWESRWQRLGIAQSLWAWTETPVVGTVSGQTTYAHPGVRWTQSGSYASVEPTLVDTDNGWVAVPRTANVALYEGAETEEPVYTDASSAMKVTTPPGP